MSTEMLTCPSCGSPVAANALLCPKCGRPNISTAFAGTYSSPQYETVAPPPASPGLPASASEPAQQAMSAPAPAIRPVPAPIPTPPTTPQPPESPGMGMGDIFTGTPSYQPELPANLRPGTLYAGPNMTVRELEHSLAASHPTPQADTLLVGGEMPRQARLPGALGTPQAQPDQDEQTLHVRPRDFNRPRQPWLNYGIWSRQAGPNNARPGSALASDIFRAAAVSLACFGGLTACFIAANGRGGIAWFLPVVIVYSVFLWWLITRSGRR